MDWRQGAGEETGDIREEGREKGRHSNTGTFLNEAHWVPFLFHIKFFKTVENVHNIIFSILMIFKHMDQYC